MEGNLGLFGKYWVKESNQQLTYCLDANENSETQGEEAEGVIATIKTLIDQNEGKSASNLLY